MNNLPQRKRQRLKDYDYSQVGYYFVTICTYNKKRILCRGEQCSPENNGRFELTSIGEITELAINNIEKHYPNIKVDNYTIMPNHIHMILSIDEEIGGRTLFAPTISRVVKQFKEYVTKQIGYSMWQKSFHDHIIRSEKEYQEISEYIETNCLKWELDKYY